MGRIAPLVAGQASQAKHGKWGPWVLASSPAGSTPIDGGDGGPIGLKVELYLGGLGWVDISQYVYYRDMVKISRGRGDETSQVPPQTCSLTLNNRDGRFSPRNPNGPWYQILGRNTPIRVSRLNNGVRRYRYHGEVLAWPTTSDISGQDVYEQITASGMLRRLAQGSQPLRSPMFRAFTINYTNAQYSFASPLTPTAYWPAEDGQNSTSIASGLSGGSPMVLSGQAPPTFATNSDFPGSAPLPQMSASIWTGSVPAVTGATANQLRFLLSVPATGEAIDGAVIARMLTSGTVARVDLVYNIASNGTVSIFGYNSSGTQLFTSAGPTGVDGHPVIVMAQLTPDATPGNVDWAIGYVFLTSFANSTGGSTVSGTLGNATSIIISPNGSLDQTVIGHVAYQSAPDDVISVWEPANAWIGESPVVRFTRLCGEQGVPAVAEFIAGPPSDPTTMGYQTLDTFGTLLQQVPDTLYGPLFEARDQLALMIRSKGTLYNQAAHLTLDHSLHELSAPLVPLEDDTYLRNDVTVTRTGGSSYQAVLTSGTLSTQPFPDGVGDYQTNYGLSLGSDSLLPDQAGWRLHMGTVDEARFPQISINLRHPTFTGSIDMMNAALTLDIGDRLDVLNPPTPQFPPDPISQIVQGYTETLGVYEHDMTINCSPQSPWRVGITDDPVFGRADTDGSTLAGDINATATSFQVATTGAATGSPLWTTSAGDFPFDVIMGGEVITVTNITGGSSPQTFGPCTRSVNGVVKTQTAGTDVRLHQPAILSI